jgi:tetratricopeptide (TPR) repeat protein
MERTIEEREKLLSEARRMGNRSEEAQLLWSLGNAYSKRGDARRAIQYLEESIKIYNWLENDLGMSHGYHVLSVVYALLLGDMEMAIHCQELAVELMPIPRVKQILKEDLDQMRRSYTR